MKLLIKEQQEKYFQAPTPNDNNYLEVLSEFDKLWNKYTEFRKYLYIEFVKVEIIPNFKKLSPEQQRNIFFAFKESNNKLEQEKEKALQPFFDILGLDSRLDDYYVCKDITDFFRHFINYPQIKDPKDIQQWKSFNDDTGRILKIWRNIYNYFYGKHQELSPPKVPILLKRKGSPDTKNESILRNNIYKLNKAYYFDDKELKLLRKSKIMQEIEIGNMIGQGAYGKVFELIGTNRAIKFFGSGLDLNGDVERMEDIIEQVYKGTASLHDFHFFDVGKLYPKSHLYYAIMPKIIPLDKSQDFKMYRRIFSEVFAYSNNLVWSLAYGKGKITDEEMLKTIKDEIKRKFGYPDSIFRTFTDEKLLSLIKARYRGEQLGGTDFHEGNIGCLAQKPDIFFYFDMF